MILVLRTGYCRQTIEIEAANVKKQIEEMKTFREYMVTQGIARHAEARS